MQYLWNFSYLWALPHPPSSLSEGLSIFWFDVTKSDWRQSLVFGVDEFGLKRRVPMYAFDLRQQIGNTGIAMAILGAAAGAVSHWRMLAAGAFAYAVALGFAGTYNVGDSHVFFLHSHLFVAVAAACGMAAMLHVARARGKGRWRSSVAGVLLLAWPAWRMVDTYPAVDRSSDRRALERVRQLAGDLAPERAVLFAQLNWQLQNGLDYYARHVRPELLVVRPGSRLLTLPLLIQENRRHGRDIVLTNGSRQLIQSAYGNLFSVEPDAASIPPTLAERIARLRSGTPYVLAVLKPYSEVPLATGELQAAYARLSGDAAARVPVDSVYTVVGGTVGARPDFQRSSSVPFRAVTRIAGLRVEVRMESWLPADTMRRAGFGHVIVGRRHALTLERGISLVALGADGRPVLTAYASSLFAPQPRFRIRAIKGA
jgi:hypothetical protein